MTLNFHRVYKELRALVPVWVVGALTILGFAFACTLEMEDETRAYFMSGVVVIYAAISFVLGAMCFGSEFDHGTLTRLLSEPVARIKIWREKNLALYLSLAALLVVLCLGLLILMDSMGETFPVVGFVSFASLVAVYAGIGGPFCALLLRQTHLAVWVSMGLPVFLFYASLFLDSILGWSNLEAPVDVQRIIRILTFPWYAIGYFLSRKIFLRMEIVPKGLRRELTAVRRFGENDSKFNARGRRLQPQNRWVALIGKELRLQRTNLFFALLLISAWLLVYSATSLSIEPQTRDFFAMLQYSLLRSGFFFFLPLAIGATAVASEREIGVTGLQLSLPISGKRQWALKVCVCIGLTALVSGLVGTNADRFYFQDQDIWRVNFTEIRPADAWFAVVAVGATIGGLYASSLAPSTLLALVGGIVLCAVTLYAVLGLITLSENRYAVFPSWSAVEWAPWLIATIVGVVTVLIYRSGYRNYADLHLDRRRIPLQVGIWVLMVYSVASLLAVIGDLYWSG